MQNELGAGVCVQEQRWRDSEEAGVVQIEQDGGLDYSGGNLPAEMERRKWIQNKFWRQNP